MPAGIGSRLAGAVIAAVLGLGAAVSITAGDGRALASTSASVPLSIAVSGNHFINGAGQTVRLLGVDRPGTEYACEEGWGYSNGDDTAAAAASDAAAIAVWHADAVRIPLNEDCWLGINGQPAYGTVAGYRAMVQRYVADLNADGIYAILDLHWSAPGTVVADGQRPMPDDHSIAFWTSVASTFASDPAVLFDLFNEPYSPAADYTDAAAYPVSWSCWRNGGCTLPTTVDGQDPGTNPATYTAVGMQALVTAIRAAGATQPILVGGLSYANDLSGWLAHEPVDPDGQLAASSHIYDGESCASTACWNAELAPIAQQVPVVIGEFDENECPAAGDGFDQTLMDWADQTGVSYLAWGWYTGATPGCGDYYLRDAGGAPQAPNGTGLHAQLAALAASTSTTSSTATSSTASSTAASSTVTATSPTAGGAPGTTITAPPSTTTTGSGPLRCTVPALIGVSLDRARRRLAIGHCRLGKVRGLLRRTSTVLSQRPRAGSRLAAGARVSVVLRVADTAIKQVEPDSVVVTGGVTSSATDAGTSAPPIGCRRSTPMAPTDTSTASEPTRTPIREATQATMVTQAVERWSAQLWAGPLFCDTWRDAGTNPSTVECFLGLLRHDGSQKPAHEAWSDAVATAPVGPLRSGLTALTSN